MEQILWSATDSTIQRRASSDKLFIFPKSKCTATAMDRRVHFLMCIMVSGILMQCGSTNDQISPSDLKKIKRQYSAQGINYFYETAFFQDYIGPKKFLYKWESDIYIHLEGILWPNDSLYVVKAVEQINNLNLPIKLHITKNKSLANLRVYFGNFTYLEKKLGIKDYHLFLGIGIIPAYSSTVKSAKVGISNNASSYSKLNSFNSAIIRQSIILEEITQVLGVTCDSWRNHNSIFFEGNRKEPKYMHWIRK